MTAAVLPLMLAGTALQTMGTLQAGKAQSEALARRARIERQQASAEEGMLRRQSRHMLGTQAAAMSQSGAKDQNIMRQSTLSAELDALKVRYEGALKGSELDWQSKVAKRESRMLAGAQLLSGTASAYTSGRLLAPKKT
jgi:hypothetical protein